MKRCIAFILALSMLLALAGCGSGEENASTKDTTSEDSALASPTAEVMTADTGDVKMDYIKFGTGEKSFVILPGLSIHSITLSADAIAAAFADFTDRYTVYVFDRAQDVAEGYGIYDMADDTAAVMQSLGIEDADIFGASQGGMIAMCLAADHPELVNAMVLGSTAARVGDEFSGVADEWISLAAKHDETALLNSFIESVYSESTVEAYRDAIISANANITDEEYTRFVIMATACVGFDCRDKLADIKCPVLVLGSEGDRVLGAGASREIADALGCEIYVYGSEYGHAVYDEAPDYRSRCLEFFSQH